MGKYLLGGGGSEDGNEPNRRTKTNWRYLRAFHMNLRARWRTHVRPPKGPGYARPRRYAHAAQLIGALPPLDAAATTAAAPRLPASGCTSSTRAGCSASSASARCPTSAAGRCAPSACTRASAGWRSYPGPPERGGLASPPAHHRMARAVRQVTVSTVISAPREQIFDFVGDLAGRPAYTDHYMHDYRLARVERGGRGRRGALPAQGAVRQGVRRAAITSRPAAPDRRGGGSAGAAATARSPCTTSPRGGRRHARGADDLQRAGHGSTGSGSWAPPAGCDGRPRSRSSACA